MQGHAGQQSSFCRAQTDDRVLYEVPNAVRCHDCHPPVPDVLGLFPVNDPIAGLALEQLHGAITDGYAVWGSLYAMHRGFV